MSELSKTNGDSDVESNSSWTLLNDEVVPNDNDVSVKKDNSQLCIENVGQKPDEPEELVKINKDDLPDDNLKEGVRTDMVKGGDVESLSSASITSVDSLPEAVDEESENREQGCLTYTEYLTERELSHDYEYDGRAEAWEHMWDRTKHGRKKCKKCKAENITTLTVVGAVLSLAGISLMCMMTPILSSRLAPDLQNKIEKNFTKVESSYATANGVKMYIDKSDNAMKLMENVNVLEPFLQACSNDHMKATDHKSQKCDKVNKVNEKMEQPMTYEQFLKEKFPKGTQNKEKGDNSKEDLSKAKSGKNQNTVKVSKVEEMPKKEQPKPPKQLKMRAEQPKKKKLKEDKINANLKKIEKKQIKEKEPIKENESVKGNKPVKEKEPINKKKNRKEFKLKKTLDKTNRYIKSSNKKLRKTEGKILEEMKNLNYKSEMFKQLDGTKSLQFSRPPAKVNGKATTPTAHIIQTEGVGAIDKIAVTSKKNVGNNVNKKESESAASLNSSNNGIPRISAKPSWYDGIYRSDIIACQLLQDICMLKLTAKLREEAKAKQKKLKRKLEKKKSHSVKMVIDADERSNEEKQKKRILGKTVERTVFESESLSKLKPEFSFKTKLNNSRSPINLSNFDLLKELPFMNENKKENVMGIEGKVQPVEKSEKTHIYLPCGRVTKRCNNPRKSISFKEIVSNCEKSKTFLENTRKKNEEKLRMLEEIKLKNRLKIEEMIRERKERIKKDASLGIYKVQFPKYADVSEELKQLKRKRVQQSFVLDSLSSSDSETEKPSVRGIESKISCELMTALKVGKKVSDTFREWTLKKAPTLTCLKNYCNSKVSQISEKLTNQRTNQTSIDSTLDNQELEALKARKEKHEQLKHFWRAKQEYLDKRIEICELLKRKLSSENIRDQSMTQGVQILDSIISDVLKNVKNCKSCVYRSCHGENKEAKNISKSAVTLMVADKKKEEVKKPSSIVKKEPFSGGSDDIYNWLFDRKATEIRKRDQSFWNAINSRPGHAERKREISKQDPSKGYHEKIIKKHN
ncbi:hypothetical protein Trydic_g939 [Trypoxylus dichotomus]